MVNNNIKNIPATAVVIGAGSRGNAYADYALKNPHELNIVGVAEPEKNRRRRFSELHNIPEENCFPHWKELIEQKKFADMAFICTQDSMHVEPSIAAINKGYHLLLEKPISNKKEECLDLLEEYKKHDVSIAVGHVLRYTAFFTRIKELIDNGEIGKIRGIQHNENIGHIHYSHSYVRGNWRNEKLSSSILLAKSCHDMDILLYLTNAESVKISSFGSKGTFSEANKPAGTPQRCLDGCPIKKTCPYFAPKIYMTGSYDWPVNVITSDLTMKGVKTALETGPYGRCIYSCDNDVLEHQAVNVIFDESIPVAFTMSAFTDMTSRTLKIVGDKGQINGHMEKNEIEIHDFQNNDIKTITLEKQLTSHGGGDTEIVRDLLIHLKDRRVPLKSSIERAVFSHLMVFAAEESRKEGKIITLNANQFG